MSRSTRRRKSSAQILLFDLNSAPDPELCLVVEKNECDEAPDSSILSTPPQFVQVSDPDRRRRDPAECLAGVAIVLKEMRDTGKTNLLLFRLFQNLDTDITTFLSVPQADDVRADFEHTLDARWRSLLFAYRYAGGGSIARLPWSLLL